MIIKKGQMEGLSEVHIQKSKKNAEIVVCDMLERIVHNVRKYQTIRYPA